MSGGKSLALCVCSCVCAHMHRHTYFISYISKELIGVKQCMGLQMQLGVGCLPSMCIGLGLRASTPKKKVEAK